MEPKVWGPCAWFFLHNITFIYPDKPTIDDIENHKNFLNSLIHVLPCIKCRVHFRDNLAEYNLDDILKDKMKYVEMMFNIHNKVNKSNNKPIFKYDDFIELYRIIIESGEFNPLKDVLYQNNKRKYIIIVLVILFISLIVGYLVKRYYSS